MIASELGHLETVKLLLAAGADVSANDKGVGFQHEKTGCGCLSL